MAVHVDLLSAAETLLANPFEANQYCSAGENALTWTQEISRNVVTPAYVLRRLALSPDAELRTAVADHINTPEAVLLFLAEDDDADVRYAIAENHNISRNVLNKLSDDANPYVASRAERTLSRLSLDVAAVVPLEQVIRRSA